MTLKQMKISGIFTRMQIGALLASAAVLCSVLSPANAEELSQQPAEPAADLVQTPALAFAAVPASSLTPETEAAVLPAAAGAAAAVSAEPVSAVRPKSESPDVKANLTRYLTRAYKVPASRTSEIIDAALAAGKRNNLDPLLLLSVTAAESTFNPAAKNKKSGASGLMQVLPDTHASRFRKHGGQVFDIRTNMMVGSELLRDLINKTGSLQRGLKHYVGAALMSHDTGYGNKITREHSRLKLAAEGEVSKAVRLQRARKPAEQSGIISGTFAEFRDWIEDLAGADR